MCSQEDLSLPLPIGHVCISASAVVVLKPDFSLKSDWKILTLGLLLSIAPDFDYALVWIFKLSNEWHRGFSHSLVFAVVLGVSAAFILKADRIRNAFIFTAAAASHTLLDYATSHTAEGGVSLFWPFSSQQYALGLTKGFEISLSETSRLEMIAHLVRASMFEVLVFGPVLLIVLTMRYMLNRGPFGKQQMDEE
jgi:inner membrane protein